MGDIAFLAHRIPYPPDRGDKIRSFHLLKALADLAPVRLLAFADDAADMAHGDALRPLCRTIHIEPRRRGTLAAGLAALAGGRPVSLAAFDSAGMRRAVAGVLADPAVTGIFAFSGQMAQFVPGDLAARRFVMDFVDMDSAKFAGFATEARGPMRWVHRREARLLAAFEQNVARRADASLFVSEAEAALFRAAGDLPAGRIRALGNGVDFATFDPDGVAPVEGPHPLIVFTGQMDYAPNVTAVTRFALEALPAIRARHPAATFAIVGRAPVAAVQALAARPGVIVTGAVADVRGWLRAADVVVAPLELARGIQNKVLEAMAMARPVVTSPAAYEGIAAVAGAELIVAEAGAQAAAVIALLDDPARAAAIGRAARARIVADYSWARQLAALADLMAMPPRVLDPAA